MINAFYQGVNKYLEKKDLTNSDVKHCKMTEGCRIVKVAKVLRQEH